MYIYIYIYIYYSNSHYEMHVCFGVNILRLAWKGMEITWNFVVAQVCEPCLQYLQYLNMEFCS